MLVYTEYAYFMVKDEFQIFFPEGDYDIHTLLDWYKINPTHPTDYRYYGDNVELLKKHFEKFSQFSGVKTKINNDMHSNPFLTVWCNALYNADQELVGFAAQEFADKPGVTKILYLNELNAK